MTKDVICSDNTRTGLIFEAKTDLATFLSKQPHYSIDADNNVFYDSKKVAQIFKKGKFYSVFLKNLKIDWKQYISKKLLPDESIFVTNSNTLFILKYTHQQIGSSVDRKIQTCDFKKKEYQKLLAPANIKVEYCYILDDWFRNKKYRDTLDYIISVNCHYYFSYLPLSEIGLPVPPELVTD